MEKDVPESGRRPAGDNPPGDLTTGDHGSGGQRSDEPFGPRASELARYNANDSHDLDPETMGQGVVEDPFEKAARAPASVLGKDYSKPR